MKRCSVADCARPHKGRGFCEAHYQRWLKYGDPLHVGVKDDRPWLERFASRVVRGDGCWGWSGSRDAFGYGRFTVPEGRRSDGAHRISYRLYCGEIGAGLHVLHRCDNPPCTRPDHLFLGTPAQNVRDAVAKRRNTRRAKHPKAKLTEEQVIEIRRSYGRNGVGGDSIPALARRYAMATSTIGAIVRGENWR